MPGPDVPTTNGHRESPRRVRKGEARPRRSDSQPTEDTLDEQVVSLRETGKSYTSVAKTLGIKRSADAHAAFLRALHARPAKERAAMTQRESERLTASSDASAPGMWASLTSSGGISRRWRDSARASRRRSPPGLRPGRTDDAPRTTEVRAPGVAATTGGRLPAGLRPFGRARSPLRRRLRRRHRRSRRCERQEAGRRLRPLLLRPAGARVVQGSPPARQADDGRRPPVVSPPVGPRNPGCPVASI